MSSPRSPDWTPGRGLGVAALFLLAFALAGVEIRDGTVDYSVFGLVDGLAGLTLTYVFLKTEVLSWPTGLWGAIVLVYAAAATAQLVGVLLPPPGVLEWTALIVLVVWARHAAYGPHRSRLMLNLGLVALVLAAFRYSFLPFVWSRTQLPRTPMLDLRAIGEGIKGLFVAYAPPAAATQAFVFGAIVLWAAAIWWQWPPEREGGWIRRLSRSERDRLLFWLLMKRGAEGREIDVSEVRGHLDRGGPEI